jgi:cyclomaltodextrinase
MATWAQDAVFYHIYPLGLCGAPRHNDLTSAPEPRLAELHGWIPHLKQLGATALYLGPLFESTAHGYDTADYYHVDRRLGSNETLARLVAALHAEGIRVVLDGVFNHVGRDFWAFRDLRANLERSRYRDWFAGLDFSRRSPCGDPFAYEGWSGNYDLVKLNLHNQEVREHLFGAVRQWIEQLGVDGLRLDAADVIDLGFLADLGAFCRALRPDFWLMGEVVHGDYRDWTGAGALDSVTNYECYKGLYSSHNDRNYYEIAYSLNRQFGEGGIYRDTALYNFVDNHDVNRVASTLRREQDLYPLYALLFTMPGVPSIYYGSEWGLSGMKGLDDWPLRPRCESPQPGQLLPHPDLAATIANFARVRQASPALRHGSYRQLLVASEQLAFERAAGDEQVVVLVNAAEVSVPLTVPVMAPEGATLVDLLDPARTYAVRGGQVAVESVPPGWARVLRRAA